MLRSPIFVIGHPRSGTSLMRTCIERHPDVWALGREAKPIWERFVHPRVFDWHSNYVPASAASPAMAEAITKELERSVVSGGAVIDDDYKSRMLKWLVSQGADPRYYECSKSLQEEYREFWGHDSGPHSITLKDEGEIGPFCFPPQGRSPTPQELERGLRIVEKSIQNCFRVDFIRRLFPDAKFVFVIREPQSSIASLINAWLHPHWFFSYRVPKPLAIKGYSDRFKWGGEWWNLSLSPGWQTWTNESLETVCARSWAVSNTFIMEAHSKMVAKGDSVLVRYEHLVENPRKILKQVYSVLELDTDIPIQELPIVMTEGSPQRDKWQVLREQIMSVRSEYASLAESMGYRT